MRKSWNTVIYCLLLAFAISACKKATAPASNATTQVGGAFSPSEEKQQRFEWNLKTLVDAYQQADHTNPKWDDSATMALKEFARSRASLLDSGESWGDIISNNATAAVQSGCDDPMVNYLYVRFAMSETNSKEAFDSAFFKVASDMEKSSYPSVRKFYADFRALQQVEWANGYPTNWSPETTQLSHLVNVNLMAKRRRKPSEKFKPF